MGKYRSSIVIVIATIVLGIGYYVSTSLVGSKEAVKHVEKNEEKEVIETWTPTDEASEADEVIETQVETEFPEGITEAEVQDAIHSMSHSKVYASEKWSDLEPTQERIDQLLDAVKRDQNGLDHSDLYIGILEKWHVGDFSEAVSDHNKIWELQGGSVGEATRLLTKEEEAEYRKERFNEF
ncbi:DUF6241 domain-containing protein [Neobacillus sp. C211]|uniref:DUF6241 domain-containing protein n=1 Tax=unclassified Neobacillus TaxID=2675272 RepID=UPI003979552D